MLSKIRVLDSSSTSITNDNSGDTIIVGNKIETNEITILDFETTDSADSTYNNDLTVTWGTAPTLDASKWKYGAQSASTTAAANTVLLDYGSADVATDWTCGLDGYWYHPI